MASSPGRGLAGGGWLGLFLHRSVIASGLWLPFLLGVVSAALLRSWWAVLVVPTALSLGTLLGIIFIGGGFPNIAGTGFIEGVTLFVSLGVVPILIGTAIGTPLGKQIERLLTQGAPAVKAPLPQRLA